MTVRGGRAVAAALLLTGCAAAPRTPAQARLEACLQKADRSVIESAQVDPDGRFSYRYWDGGGGGPEVEKFRACLQGRAPAYPTVR